MNVEDAKNITEVTKEYR